MSTHSAAPRTGFTLMELLVSLTLAALVATLGAMALGVLTDRSSSMLEAGDELSAQVAVRATIRRVIAAGFLTLEEDDIVFRGIDGAEGAIPRDELTFFSRGDGTTVPAASRVRIHHVSSISAPGLALDVREVGRSESRERILRTPVGGLSIHYLSASADSTLWVSSWVSTTLLPLAVRIELLALPGDSLPPLLRLPIVVPLVSRS